MLAHRFEAIGTQWSIETATPLTQEERNSIAKMIDEFDAVYSRFRDDSTVVRAYRGAGSWKFPRSIMTLFDTYTRLNHVTAGRVNPLVGESLERLGYDASYSLNAHSPAAAPPLDETVSLTDTTLTFARPALLDVGAVGKGLLVDMVAAYVAKTHERYVIDGGGDMAVCIDTPEAIGLEHPDDPTRVIGVVRLSQGSVCGSALNRRTWGKGLHHVLDATTGRPVERDIIATWVVAKETMIADALATGLFFARPAALEAAFGAFQYVIMRADSSVEHNMTPEVGELFI